MAWGLVGRGVVGAFKLATSGRGLLAAGLTDQIAFDGAGLKTVIGATGLDPVKNIQEGAGLDPENIKNFFEDIKAGNWADVASNPLVISGAGILATAISLGKGGGALNAVFTGLLVAGMAYVAQKHILPSAFGEASDPSDGAENAMERSYQGPAATTDTPVSAPIPGGP